jgi:hypothetical protein
MDFATITRRLLTYSWLIILLGIGFSLLFFPWVNDKQYQAAISVGLNFNQLKASSQSDATDLNSHGNLAYVQSLTEFSLYLEKRLSSIEIQDKIARSMGISPTTFNEKKPFYKVTNQSGGFASLSYTASDQAKAEAFVSAAKESYLQVVKEWNEARSSSFSISPMKDFSQTIAEVSQPKQLQALPTLAGLALGVGLSLILPIKSVKTKKS